MFVEHYLKNSSNTHPSYLQDAPDFLRFVENIQEEDPLPENTTLASIDVSGFYTHIHQDECLESVNDALDQSNLPFPKEFIVKLTLKYNIFEFNSK